MAYVTAPADDRRIAETRERLRAPWIVRRGERFPPWFAGGVTATANVKFVPVERHKVQVFVLTDAEVDKFYAEGRSHG